VLLPEVEHYQPTDTGESPLANIAEWVNVECPRCAGPAKRETDTMPNWAGSSWYFLRYCDFNNDQEFASQKNLAYWTPIDWYNGGMEHTVLHLLYSRFWHKFLYDLKLVPTSEPYKKRTSHGLILSQGGEKMSKSKGNVVNPDMIIQQYGADTLRVYEMFMGPFEQAIVWSEESLVGPRRFLEKVWRLRKSIVKNHTATTPTRGSTLMHQTIKKVSEDIAFMRFNTAVSSLMIYANELERSEIVSEMEYETLLKLIAPIAPHISEELWAILGHQTSIHMEAWPSYDPAQIEENIISLAVQINGKVRASLSVVRDESEEAIRLSVMALPEVKKWLHGLEPQKVIIVPGRIVSIVV
jgi:leucyl-tRNA synthetase